MHPPARALQGTEHVVALRLHRKYLRQMQALQSPEVMARGECPTHGLPIESFGWVGAATMPASAMTYAVFHKLLAIFLTVGVGYVSSRLRWFGEVTPATARLLGDWVFNVFISALLFRTTARLDFAHLPWHALAAYYVPAVAVALLVYGWRRRAHGMPPEPAALAVPISSTAPAAAPATAPAAAATHAVASSFGNTVQLGIPLAAALFGEQGLALHITLLSMHVLIILSLLTVLAEVDLARAHAARHGAQPLWPAVRSTLRNTLIHPVMLPVLAGLLWNSTGLGLHPVIDETLLQLASAAVPVCLVLIGVSLQAYGLAGHVRPALPSVASKLLLLPAAVLVVAHWGFGFQGTPLAVLVMMAATPVGSNALLFAQRYETLEAEATASIVISTLAFVVTASLWLAVLTTLGALRAGAA